MNWVIEQAASHASQPTMLIRYVDDIFCITSDAKQLNSYFKHISSIHPNIQFSKDLEQCKQLAYLDVHLIKNAGKIETSVFRKKTATGLYTKWSSFCPHRYNINLINCLLTRSYRICNSYRAIHKEFEHITDMLLKNGYPLSIINSQIREFLDNKHQQNCTNTQASEPAPSSPRSTFLYLPFLGNSSSHFEKELKTFFHKHLGNKLKLSVIHTTFKIDNFFRYKEQQPFLRRSNVVYKLKCSCDAFYIGQTRRNLITRIQEHNPDSPTGQQTDIAKHLLENPSHAVNFDQPEIIASAFNYRELLIKETLFIHQLNPSINVDESSTPLFLFNT